MLYTISVPDMDDSIALANIGGRICRMRFRWDTVGEYWEFGVFDPQINPIFIGVKIVPNFPLNLFSGKEEFSDGHFFALTNEDRLTRYSFVAGLASFIFVEDEND